MVEILSAFFYYEDDKMKKIIMLKTDEGQMSGRMRRLLKDKVYNVTNFLAEVLINTGSAKLHKTRKAKQAHPNKAIISFDNKEI